MGYKYKLLQKCIRIFFELFFRFEIKGAEHIPMNGPTIIASNHISLWDPLVIGAALPRKIHFMAKEELFAIPVFQWIIRKLNAFPVKRGASDRNAIRMAIRLLEENRVVGLFPEGTRSKTGILGKPEPGLVMIAAKAGATIIPVALQGTNQVGGWKKIFPKFTISFGKPIVIEKDTLDKERMEIISQTIMLEIGRMLENG